MYQDKRKLDFKPIGAAIKKAREEKGWTQEYLAQLVDLTPRSIMYIENEWYCRDTSKQIRAVMKIKGEAGEHLCTNPPYGYMKDTDNPKQWVVDSEAAEVVKRIFAFCLEGYGRHHSRHFRTSRVSRAHGKLQDLQAVLQEQKGLLQSH